MEEVAIDRFNLSVAGQWRASRAAPNDLSVSEYFALISAPTADDVWFRSEGGPDKVTVRTRADASTTLGRVKLTFSERRTSSGNVYFRLTGGNITRTLHHLLVSHGHFGGRFIGAMADLDPFRFFAKSQGEVPIGFGKNADNWISDYALLHDCLGQDPFDAFHPVYVRQLQRLIAWLVLPHYEQRHLIDGDRIVSTVPGIECAMAWGSVRVPQMEAYFERRHSHARGAVRLLASAALFDFDDADARRYINNASIWAEREEDDLSVGMELRDTYRLAIYAKYYDRIRFEVRRKGKPASPPGSLPTPDPATLLLAKIRSERENLLTAAQWAAAGALMDEHPTPQLSDLVQLCDVVQRLCAAHECAFASVLSALLEDGGIRANSADGWPEALIGDLERAGVVYRVTLRRRDHRNANKRYALRPEYRGLLNLISRSLVERRGLTPERP